MLTLLAVGSFTLSGCLHILEEVTIRKNGTGTYKMTIDLGELKGMMDMMKGMMPDSLTNAMQDSTAIAEMQPEPEAAEDVSQFSQMGEQLIGIKMSLAGVQGISNIAEIKDTVNLKFSYSFDFADVTALNRALKIINKDKFESKAEEIYKFSSKGFERLNVGDIGSEMQRAMAENMGEDADESSMSMVKMFFADMSYTQVYNFPDQQIKKSSNKLAEISADKHSISLKLKPFDEDQQKQKASVANKLKLK